MRLLVMVLVLVAGCGGRSSVGGDAAAVDTRARDVRPAIPDSPWGDRVFGCSPFAMCPAVSGSKICLQGQVFRAPALMAYWAGDRTLADLQNPNNGHLVTTNADGAIVKIYDPIDFVTNPAGSQPLAEVNIDDNGCFVTEPIAIPFSNLFAVGVDDKLATGTSVWALAALGEKPTVGRNSENLLVPAVTEGLAGKWGHSFYKDGTMFAVYQGKFTQKGVEGVVPLFDGNPPALADQTTGAWKFPTSAVMDVFYTAADPSDPTKIVDPSATATTKTGIAIIRKAEVKNFHGEKAGCTINGGEAKLGGSSPGTLFFHIFDVEGC